jgi:ATPase subunit of ABC transporter with duplicated ATPase domains
MPSSIVVKDLAWSTPDGNVLFSGLSLSFGPGRTGLVGRNGVGKTTLLRLLAGELTPRAGTVVVAGRAAFLRQIVGGRPGETIADAFAAREVLALLDSIAAGTAAPERLAEADWSLPARLGQALARVGLPDLSPDRPLDTLSGGQRTRLRLAALLFAEPDAILLDEPTNDLDAEGRAAVARALEGWRGAAIVVSHDRDLLDRMDAIVELTSLGATTYGGNWTLYRERKALESAALERRLDSVERKVEETERRIQMEKERKARRDGAGQRKRERGDAPKILMDARRERAQATGGGAARLGERQRASVQTELAEVRAEVEVVRSLAVTLSPTGLPRGKTVAEAVNLTGGYDPANPVLRGVSFTIAGPERVAVAGPNGSGKTTLLKLLTGRLKPYAGTARLLGRHAVLDQWMSLLDPRATIRDNFRRLNPDADENACRAALARFLFRADAALRVVGTLSGGETLRAGLAAVLGGPRPPEILLLDEPTNHLDLTSVEAMEAGLSAYDGALLVVSHDPAFLDAIGIERRIALEAYNGVP